MILSNFLSVGCGGFLGAIARYSLSGWLTRLNSYGDFPIGTLADNVLGCFLIGILGGLVERLQVFHPTVALFLITGILGGFTTFSAFGFETVFLLRRGAYLLASLNVIGSLTLGLLGVGLGTWLVFALTHR